MKRIVATLLIMVLLPIVLCACGGGTKYTLFAYDYDGCVIAAEDMSSELTLNENGTGRMTINGKSGRISSWTEENGDIILNAGSETLSGTIRDGILTVDPGDGSMLYYAAENADTSSVPVMSFEDYLYQSIHGDDAN